MSKTNSFISSEFMLSTVWLAIIGTLTKSRFLWLWIEWYSSVQTGAPTITLITQVNNLQLLGFIHVENIAAANTQLSYWNLHSQNAHGTHKSLNIKLKQMLI